MGFEFFTFGGSQFWADVFFYQKWRIQRNCVSKSYRLLDSWDIVRHRGTFEECRKAFVNYIDIYELPRQSGPMIVMLHGFGENKNIFKPLWRKALDRGYMAAAVNYPSMQCNIESHVRQLIFLLNNMEDTEEVSFVSSGVGGILLRKLFSINAPWQQKLRIGRIVQVCPPNHGCRLIHKLSRNPLTRWIFGPMTEELSEENIAKIPGFPPEVEVGIIYCRIPNKGFYAWLPERIHKLLPDKNESKLAGATDFIEISNSQRNVFKNRSVVSAVMNFIDLGRFR